MTSHRIEESDLPASVLNQINDICDRFEAAWESGTRPDLSEFLCDADRLADELLERRLQIRECLFCELLLSELDQRQKHDLSLDQADWLNRFPQFAAKIGEAFQALSKCLPVPQHLSTVIGHRPHIAPDAATTSDTADNGMPTAFGVYQRGPRIGSGGMGVVYRGRDTRLGRDVAIKVVSQKYLGDPELIKRFQREASAVARLSHPNIVILHDIGFQPLGSEVSIPFIVMELLDGESLRQRQLRPLEASESLRIACGIADGLAAAHGQGIIHRDVKPENVFLLQNQQVKVLDFGLARIISGTSTDDTFDEHRSDTQTGVATQAGRVLGTYGYMAPEQLRGQQATTVSDIFALTCVLFEMLTSVRAFQGQSSADVASATLRDDPLAHENLCPDVAALLSCQPASLRKLLADGFEKDPQARCASAMEFASVLREAMRDAGTEAIRAITPAATYDHLTVTPIRHARAFVRNRPFLAASGAVLVLISASILFSGGIGRWLTPQAAESPQAASDAVLPQGSGIDHTAPDVSPKSVAVLPFVMAGSESDAIFAQGITISLTNNLSQCSELEVRPYSSTAVYAGSGNEVPPDLRDIARQLQVSSLISGSIDISGETFTIVVELIDGERREVRWSQQFLATKDELLARQSEITAEIGRHLGVMELQSSASDQVRGGTTNLEAYRQFILGQVAWLERTPSAMSAAIDSYRKAIALDPQFADAWAGMAQCCITQAERDLVPRHEALATADDAISRAMAIDDTSVDAIVTQAMILFEFRWRFADAERRFDAAMSLMPHHALGCQWYSELLSATAQHEAAIDHARRACGLNPRSPITSAVLGRNLFKAGRLNEAIEQLQSTLDEHPDFHRARGYLIEVLEEAGDFDSALRHWKVLARGDAVANTLDHAFRQLGPSGYWQARLDHSTELSALHPVSEIFLAGAHARLGSPEHLDQAFDLLNNALEKGSPALAANLLVHPAFGPLRDDVRYGQLIQSVGY